MTQNTQPVLLTSKELADRWKLSERTIINMRSENRGVPATKLGRSVRIYYLTLRRLRQTSKLFLLSSCYETVNSCDKGRRGRGRARKLKACLASTQRNLHK